MTDYYKILGISPDAGESEIRTAYRRLARKYHPDAGAGSSAAAFRTVQDAYELLSNPERRMEYDRSRESEGLPNATRSAFHYAVPHYSARSSHIDLREVMGSGRANRAYAEPIFRSSTRDIVVEDPWEELLEFLLRDLGS